MKIGLVLLVALLLGACAHKPELAGTAPHVSHAQPAKIAQPAPVLPAPEAKPETFRHRWFDRFMKHKPK